MLLRCALILFLATAACPAADSTFFPAKLAEMDATIRLAIADGRLPGGVLWLEREGERHVRAFGAKSVEPRTEAAVDTIYDAASLTKVLATTPAIMRLVEAGKIDIYSTVARYLPEFTGGEKDAVTVRHLLTHTAGTKPGISTAGWDGWDAGIAKAAATPLAAKPGEVFRYSDINFILLGGIVARVSGVPLDTFCAAEIFAPLGMKDTAYRPDAALHPRIAPTTNGTPVGTVHDPTARKMGGVAGHAGLFTTAGDIARFARMMLDGGTLDGVRIFKKETVALMTTVQSPAALDARRGLGWDIDTGYSGPRGNWLPLGSYGHTGWTGGSLWIDPFSRTAIILLANRNHPTEAGNVLPLRKDLGTLGAEAVRSFNFLTVPGALSASGVTFAAAPRELRRAAVLTGIDVLARDDFAPLRGKRVGLITNHTGIDRQRRRTIDLLAKAKGVTLTAIFSPEHGVAGQLDEEHGDARDTATGIPVFSLYGKNRAPTAAHLARVDILIFDIQDIGTRYYTYISTMGECLLAASRENKPLIVLDRPNPIGGHIVQGPVRDGPGTFTAWHDIPIRHGMTTGELARMIHAERQLTAPLTVIPCEGWVRPMWHDETGLPWVHPSPNIRSLNAATLYPGLGILEFCKISVGRGTDTPFEILGAPYLDDLRLAAELNAAQLPGIRFTPIRFTPKENTFAGKECRGVRLTITDRDSLNPCELGIEIARTLQRLESANWGAGEFDKLLAHPATRNAVLQSQPLSAIRAGWMAAREAFAGRRARWLIYGE